ncbi:hypothetical protein ACFFRR_009900 [Megaselia abdita]
MKMNSSDELVNWLNNKEKSLEDRWIFSVKVWSSPELTSTHKFPIILEWITNNIFSNQEPASIIAFLELQCSPGSIADSQKSKFIHKLINWSDSDVSDRRLVIDVLVMIMEHETYQGYFQSTPNSICLVQKQIFKIYIDYLVKSHNIVVRKESLFFLNILEKLKSHIKKGFLNDIVNSFTSNCLGELVEVIITAREQKLNFFDELLEIQKLLYPDYDLFVFNDSFLEFPVHVKLLLIECSILNFRGDVVFARKLLNSDLFKNNNPREAILGFAFILEKFQKYSVNLNFQIAEKVTVVQHLGESVTKFIDNFYDEYFEEIIQLICSALCLNPLILEKHIYGIAARLIATKAIYKKIDMLMELFLNMVKKLSRSEKFVSLLFKALQVELDKISEVDEIIPSKKMKLHEDENIFLEKLFNETFQIYNNNTKGFDFSSLVVDLMTKPSLVIWKSLVFTFSDILDNIKESVSEKNLILLECISRLWCDYFKGTRVYEQIDKFTHEMEQAMELTKKMLKEFGYILLNSEHNTVIMNFFQSCCHHFGNFQLMFYYYKPESFKQCNLYVHDYLSKEEWDLIKQRIANFGILECKINNDKILAQEAVARILVQQNKLNLKKCLNYSSFSNIKQIKAFFETSENHWIFKYLKSNEKNVICEKIVEDNDLSFILNFVEIKDILERIILLEFKAIAGGFSLSKNSTFNEIDFSTDISDDILIGLIAKDEENIKKCSVDIIKKILLILQSLPIAFCSKQLKTKVTLLYLCLYKDLFAAKEQQLAEDVLEMLLHALHFGESIAFHKYITFNIFLKIVSPKKYPTFYTMLFNNLKLDFEFGKIFIETVVKHIKKMDKEDEQFFDLLNLCLNYLSSPFAPKDFKKYIEELHKIVWKSVENYFNTKSEGEETRLFVEKSLPSFSNYFHSFFNNHDKNADIDESMRKIFKIFIGNSIFYNNPHAIKLMTIALNNRVPLHFDPDEIEFVLQKYWDKITHDFKVNEIKNSDLDKVVKMVINNRSNEDFLKMLKSYEQHVDDNNVLFVCRIFLLILNCNLSNIKGAILNEEFKQISSRIFLTLKGSWDTILTLIECQTCLCKNLKVSLKKTFFYQ